MALEKPKYTAEAVAAWRAAGAKEKDERVRNPDFLAVKFLGLKFYLISRFPPLTKLALRKFEKVVPGGYYFHIVRTKHIDATLGRAIEAGLEQLVILGAGYDSRPYRFRDQLKGVRVFEVDLPGTQARKEQRLAKLFGTLPDWVTFVPIDFNTQRLDILLPESGYDPRRKTFFIWEGVCMYISPEAVDEALSFVSHHSGPGSSIVFDYIYRTVVDGTCDYYGAREVLKYVTKIGEPYLFGIEEGKAEQFLSQRGFQLVTNFGPQQLEQMYLIRQDGRLHGRMYGYTDIVHALVRPGTAASGPRVPS